MLKEILSISGKPGLYKLVSQGKNMLIVESLADGKRIPAYARDKAVSLGDIAIFTETEEVPLGEVLEKVKAKENGAKASIDPKSDNDTLRSYLEEVLPEYDKDRVYPSDIRKMINWYNILIEKGITEFLEKEEEAGEEKGEKEAEIKTKKDTKPTASKKEPKVQVKQPKVTQKPMANRKMGG
ncbi:MAG: DUF5606 domain-containing protein [Porphyromonadaceae bacterium]|nr:DUF5606 domain-containing protein [Porphyromonadaceae bacterium]